MGQQQTKQLIKGFHQAVRNGTMDKVKEGLDQGMPLDNQDDVFGTALHETVCFNRFEVAELLLQHKAEVNAHTFQKNGETVLMAASRKGLLTFVDLFVRSGAKVNQVGPGQVCALHLALENGHQDVAKFLLESGANIGALDANGCTPLHIACRKGLTSVAEAILSKSTAGIDSYDKLGMTPLMYATQLNNVPLFDVLIANGAHVSCSTESGSKEKEKEKERGDKAPVGGVGLGSPLHVVSSPELASRLLELGASVTARDENSYTPLHTQAMNSSNNPIVLMLLRQGADPNSRAKGKVTPLHLAATNGALRNAELLLHHGADVNALDDAKSTPLHFSSAQGFESLSRLLLEHSADKEIKNSDGRTPAELAMMVDE